MFYEVFVQGGENMSDRFEVKFRYNTPSSKTSRASISSTSVSASSLSEARNKVVSSRSSGNGIKVISVVKK